VKTIARERPELIPKHDSIFAADIPAATQHAHLTQSWHFAAARASLNIRSGFRFNHIRVCAQSTGAPRKLPRANEKGSLSGSPFRLITAHPIVAVISR
jgi:hypothetical protein